MLAVLLALLLGGCSADETALLAAEPSPAAGVRFRDVADAAGLHHEWRPQPRPFRILEASGRGCAFVPRSGAQGALDILLVDAPHPIFYRRQPGGRTFVPAPLPCPPGDWRACAVGDVNGDGHPDLILNGYHCLALLLGDGQGGWRDATREWGLPPDNRGRWGGGAGLMDLNGDGYADLVLLNYVRFGPDSEQYCQFKPGLRSGCPPSVYEAERPDLWINVGGRHLAEVSAAAGMGATHGKALVLAFTDTNGDGHPDFYVGNDGPPADLLVWRRNLPGPGAPVPVFENRGIASGVAFATVGNQGVSAMCADWGDYDGDGLLDLTVSAFSDHSYSLLRALGGGQYEHMADRTGLTAATFKPLGFGGKWVDFENDGWLDLIFANGHVYDNCDQIDSTHQLRQPLMLLRNEGGRTFVDVVPLLGGELARPLLGRGLATGDFNDDGLADVLVVDYEGRPLLLENASPAGNSWLRVVPEGLPPNQLSYGARVTVRSGERLRVAEVSPASSYYSASDPRLLFGLGRVGSVEEVRVRWLSGRELVLRDVEVNRELRPREADARPAAMGGGGQP